MDSVRLQDVPTGRRRHALVARWAAIAGVVLLFGVVVAPSSAVPGPNNAITDVPGIEVGHSTRVDALTGTTAILFRNGALMGYAPSGGAPGDRLGALLTARHQDSERIVFHGLTLSGGSIYGLDTACGVVKYLREQGIGYGTPKRPYVPGAIIFDLGRGSINAPPGRSTPTNPYVCSDGYIAASTAAGGHVAMGSVGGGTGASAGGLRSGFGTASVALADGIFVGAAVIVNSGGGVYNTVDGTCELYALWLEDSNEFGDTRAPTGGCAGPNLSLPPIVPGQNTTIGVIATNAPLTAGQAERMAIIAGDGMARAIRPAHGAGDGDTVFGVVTSDDPSTVGKTTFQGSVGQINNAAADAYSRAIVHAILNADPALSRETYCERFPSACPTAIQSLRGPDTGAAAPTVPPAKPSAGAVAGVAAGGGLGVPLGLVAALAALMAVAAALVTRRGRFVARRVRLALLAVTGMVILGGLAAPAMAGPSPAGAELGPQNSITDVPGVEVGHSTRADARTGTTSVIFRAPAGALVGFASLGGAPETHLAELLNGQHQETQRVALHGIVLSGGSVFGLDTICGTRAYMDSLGVGFGGRAHITGATTFDLGRGEVDAPPGTGADPCTDGFIAASTANAGPALQGSVGGGTGARAGDLVGGVGTASTVLPDGTIVGALVVVNSSGRVYDPNGDCGLYALTLELGDEFGNTRVPPPGCQGRDGALPAIGVGEAATIGVVATSRALTAGQTEQLAWVVGDGIAQAIRPAHASSDGNVVYAVTLADNPSTVPQTEFVEAGDELDRIFEAAVNAYSRAIVHAVLNANPDYGTTYCEKFPTACVGGGNGPGAGTGFRTGGPAGSVLPPVAAPVAQPSDGIGLSAPAGALLGLMLAALAAAVIGQRRLLARRAKSSATAGTTTVPSPEAQLS